MRQESQAGLSFLCPEEKTEDSPWDLATIRASHAETVLELQKSRQLLLLEHRISRDLQVRINRHSNANVYTAGGKKDKREDVMLKVLCLHVGDPQQHVKSFNQP